MSVFIRRFTTEQPQEVLLEIEAVNILDLEPPAEIRGIGSGTVMLVGEFEAGPFNKPMEIASPVDLAQVFGGFGFARGGTLGNDPCARSRLADSAIVPEFWNGNGFVQLNGKKFARLIIVRVDTSVGEVQFTRLAYITGAAAFRYNLEPAQTLVLTLDGGAPGTSTFNATAATVTGVGGTFPTLFTGGQTLTVGYDSEPDFTVTFFAADQSLAQVISRINATAGFAFADNNAGQLRFTGRRRGSTGQVRIVSGSSGVLTTLGLTAANTAGTGNVADIDAVTLAEIRTIVELTHGASNVEVEQDINGNLRITNTATPGTGTILVGASSTAVGLGFVNGTLATAVTGVSGVLPAGTRVRNSGGTVTLVTMQDLQITAASAGPYKVKVRHAMDDGTGLSAGVGTITVVPDPPVLGAFSVTNLLPINAAMTEAQIDTAYQTTYDNTLDPNTVAREVNISWSARQSNAVRRKVRSNAIDASTQGLFGRVCVIRTPMNTTRSAATSISAEPGVGAYRSQNVIFTYPQVRTRVPAIAAIGLAGGAGFTADGLVDIGADGFLCSIMSQLPPEENPGQLTTFTEAVVSLESGSNVQGFTMPDYITFKKAGICAPRMDEGVLIFQSGVVSVDPTVNPNLVNINRRRMAYFVQDTLARRAKFYGKKLQRLAIRLAFVSEIRSFLQGLLGTGNSAVQRIAGFTIDSRSNNTPQSLAKGIFRVDVFVRTLASMDAIVLAVTAGETVEVTETLGNLAA
jgi:hypothetical protein